MILRFGRMVWETLNFSELILSLASHVNLPFWNTHNTTTSPMSSIVFYLLLYLAWQTRIMSFFLMIQSVSIYLFFINFCFYFRNALYQGNSWMYPDPNVPQWEIIQKNPFFSGYLWVIILSLWWWKSTQAANSDTRCIACTKLGATNQGFHLRWIVAILDVGWSQWFFVVFLVWWFVNGYEVMMIWDGYWYWLVVINFSWLMLIDCYSHSHMS